MAGFGLPEVILIFVVGSIISLSVYGIVLVADAIKRPSEQFNFGTKGFWIIILILTNPLINIGKFFGKFLAVLGFFMFITAAITYHVYYRRGNSKKNFVANSDDQTDSRNEDISRAENREARMRKRFSERKF